MENTLQNKINFFRLYPSKYNIISSYTYEEFQNHKMNLRCLSTITDEELKDLCLISHNISGYGKDTKFVIKRRKDHVHCSMLLEKYGIEYHICLNYFHATINCNTIFEKTPHEKEERYKTNIGEIHFSSRTTVPYIHAVDFLRSKEFLIPYLDLTISRIKDYEWINLLTHEQHKNETD